MENTSVKIEQNINKKQFIVFTMENEDYGIEIQKIMTIERLLPMTRVPNTPFYLKGVINLRGDIIPVIDLRKRFSLPEVEGTDDTRVVISNINDILIGYIVDQVEEVIEMNEEFIDDSSGFSKNEVRNSYINSIGRYDDKVVSILNLEKLLKITEEDLGIEGR